MKICTECKVEKDTESFSWTRVRGKPLRRAKCRVCQKEYDRKRYAAGKKKPSKAKKPNTDPTILKDCTGCGTSLPATLTYYHKLKRGKYGLDPSCKTCRAIQKKVAYRKNPAKYRDRWRKHKRDRAGMSGSHSEQEWLDLQEHYGYKCVICNEPKPLTRDHIIPVTRGGSDNIENIQPACQECNSRKGNRLHYANQQRSITGR